jgi:tRNA pseudouridine55 synthase
MKPLRHGFLLVDKPAGPTSHDIVQVARRAIRERRIGHTGTLDPTATGLLMLCIGKATRLQSFLLAWEKTYEGEIALGLATTTYDTEGEPLAPAQPVPPLGETLVAELEARFSGSISQLPPPYSAKKLAGRKLYELARAGEEVPLEPKQVTIHELRLTPRGGDRLAFSVTCSSGTYVRSLAHDIGELLRCGGHLAALRRARIGPWLANDAVSVETLTTCPAEIPVSAWVSLRQARLPFAEVGLNPTALAHFTHGQEVVVRELDGPFSPGSQVAVRDRDGNLIGIGTTVTFLPRARTLTLAPRMVLGDLESDT